MSSDLEKQIKIAEIHGYTQIKQEWKHWGGPDTQELRGFKDGYDTLIPDYLNSQDAIYEAVQFAVKECKVCPLDYTEELLQVVNTGALHYCERGCFKHTNAAAAQRADALINTFEYENGTQSI